MISWLAAFGLLVAFVVLARAFGLTERSRNVLATTRESMAVMRAASLSDDAEGSGAAGERHRLFKSFLTLSNRSRGRRVCCPPACCGSCDRLGWL